MVINKQMQKAIGFINDEMTVHVVMKHETAERNIGIIKTNFYDICNVDTIATITTRRSVRKFTSEAVLEKAVNTILNAGFCAPSASNKRLGL